MKIPTRVLSPIADSSHPLELSVATRSKRISCAMLGMGMNLFGIGGIRKTAIDEREKKTKVCKKIASIDAMTISGVGDGENWEANLITVKVNGRVSAAKFSKTKEKCTYVS